MQSFAAVLAGLATVALTFLVTLAIFWTVLVVTGVLVYGWGIFTFVVGIPLGLAVFFVVLNYEN